MSRQRPISGVYIHNINLKSVCEQVFATYSHGIVNPLLGLQGQGLVSEPFNMTSKYSASYTGG